MDESALRELLTSPIEQQAPRRRGPRIWILIGAAGALLITIGVVLGITLGGGGSAATTTIPPAFSEPGVIGPRTLAPLIADTTSGRLLLFAGATLDATGRRSNLNAETWQYDPAGGTWWWLFRQEAPQARAGHGAAYDAGSEVTIVFGGAAGSYDPCPTVFWCADAVLGDTLAFDAVAGRWEEREPTRAPPARFGTAMAYDPATDRIILFGGGGIDEDDHRLTFADTWAFDAGTDTWTDLAPPQAPPARAHHTLVYDARLERILLWGGKGFGMEAADLWAYDPATNTWAELEPIPGIGPRWLGAAAHHTTAGRTFVVGGEGPITEIDRGLSAEVWSYGADGWQQHGALDEPVWRHGLAYAGAADQLVLLTLGRTLAYDPAQDLWVDLTPEPEPPTPPQE